MCVLHRARMAGCLLLLVLLAALSGCGVGGKGKGTVKGQVVFFDKKLTAGTVIFITQDGRSGSGNIDFSGNYTVPDAPVGVCTVTVSVPKMTGMPGGMQGGPKPPPGLPPMKQPGSGEAESSTLIDPSKIVQIPAKYANKESSGLTFTVERGENTYNITLTP
jgi:hypothetical protein